MNMFALSDADPGGGGGVRWGYTGFGTVPPKTKKYPNSIKIWTF